MNATCSLLRRRKHLIQSLLTLLSLCVLVLVSLRHTEVIKPFLRPAPSRQSPLHRYNVSCSKIYDMDPVEIGNSLVLRRKHVVEDKEETLVRLLKNCSTFLASRGYGDVCVSEEEELFPLAYSMVVHKNAWMVERLLRALYSPGNVYCIHYDQKSASPFAAAMEGLARCLPNVFIASKREFVDYASISRLKADLNCLSDLLKSEVRWRYVLNLCGQDFPLKSNVELVSELKKLNGANMLETSRPSEMKKKRFGFHHELRHSNMEYGKLPVRTSQKKPPPPHGIQVFIGNAYFVLSREFVKFMDLSVVVADFLAWSEDTYSPDEHFWATLVRLPGVPGEIPQSKADVTDLMSKTRLVKWEYLEGRLYPACTGKHVRSVCIYGVGEMHWLLNYGHWFANKFDPAVDPVLIQCLEEKLEEKQRSFLSSTACHQRLKVTTDG